MTTKPFLAITGLVIALLATGTYMASSKTTTNQVAMVADTAETAAVSKNTVSPAVAPIVPTQATAATTPSPTPVTQTTTTSSLYKDGTYTASGTYDTPEEETETIKVSITLKNDLIVDASVTPSTSNNRESQRYQKQLIAGFKALVTGKKITAASLSVVSGSSLTSSGWNAAVASIKAQAKV